MITKPLLLKIFEAANIQRWNDKIRPVELVELDKQAHKMIIAYLLGKFEEEKRGKDFDWIEIIEGGIFELLQRLIITDLKPPLFYRIKEDKEKYQKLNQWVYRQIEPLISPLGKNFCQKFKSYLLEEKENLNRRILSAAHFYATHWEFKIIERANPGGFEIAETKEDLQKRQEKYYDLKGIQQLALYSNLRNFVDICGQLRFQIRWSHLPRVPRTSVLGHMLIVAILSYLLSLQIKACRKRGINNFLTGLFHDLPEVLTRDIINPVKESVEGLKGLIKTYERKEMEERIYKLIPKKWHSEMKKFAEDEFVSLVTIKGRIVSKNSDEISKKFNKDRYNPRDGEIVRAVDHLTAFIEAYLARESGITNEAFEAAINSYKKRYGECTIAGINFGKIYAEFD